MSHADISGFEWISIGKPTTNQIKSNQANSYSFQHIYEIQFSWWVFGHFEKFDALIARFFTLFDWQHAVLSQNFWLCRQFDIEHPKWADVNNGITANTILCIAYMFFLFATFFYLIEKCKIRKRFGIFQSEVFRWRRKNIIFSDMRYIFSKY